jgi:predicted transcriptional regulator
MPPTPDIATAATQQLLDALAERPDASAAELADAAGIGRSTASKLLVTLAAQGRALRRRGGHQGGRRTPERWTLITTTATTRDTTAASPALAATSSPQAVDVDRPPPAPGRLGAGQLQELVEACLAQRPDQPLSATAVAKTLDRSAGAVANALQTLASQGRVLQAQTNPRRYVIAAASHPAAATD